MAGWNPPQGGQQPYGGYGQQQPGYGGPQPGYGPPQQGYGGPQPGYGPGPAAQPGYGAPQPGYGPQPGGFAPMPPQRKKSNTGLIIGVAIALIVVVAIGAGIALYFVGKTSGKAYKVAIPLPSSAGGMTKVDNPDPVWGGALQGVKRGSTPSDIGTSTESDGAVYKTGEVNIIVNAYNGAFKDPDSVFNKIYSGPSSGASQGLSWHKVDAGPHGGMAACGSGVIQNITASFCAFETKGDFGEVISYGFPSLTGGPTIPAKTLPELQSLMLNLRTDLETPQ